MGYNGFSESVQEKGDIMICILICDDSIRFASQLRIAVETAMRQRGFRVKIHEFHCAEEIGTEILSSCDIAFLDIDFKDKDYNGIDTARRLRRFNNDAIIIFVTNYIEYAPTGYEVQAFRYILKNEMSQKLEATTDQIIAHLQTERSRIKIQSNGEVIDVPIQNILFIESKGHTLLIHMTVESRLPPKCYSIYSTLSKMEADLKEYGFLRIHKSYLINMRHIKTLNCNEAYMDDGTHLSVGSRNYSECKKQYLLWRGQQ